MKPFSTAAWALLWGGSLLWGAGQATPTQVMVRVVSKDAKVIGSGVGGARVTIKEVESGRILAEGLQQGGTGDTRKIMVEPHRRGEPLYDQEGTAGFLAELSLSRPTRVEIIAEGPLGTPQATQRASKTLLLIPGQHVLGDGVILEIHGLTVSLLAPQEGEAWPAGSRVAVRATVRMT